MRKPQKRKSEAERFWPKVDKGEGCWEWTASKDALGYGRLMTHRRGGWTPSLAHRVSWELANGPIPEGMLIDHICHNSSCVNPAHLRLATKKQNGEHRQGAQSNSKTGILGVIQQTRPPFHFQVEIGHNMGHVYVGTFQTIEEAAEAARLKRIELFTHNDLDRAA